MKITTAITEIAKAFQKKLSVYIHGSPGIGKSDMIHQIAQATRENLITIHPAQMEPIDLRGLPTVQEGKTIWLTPSFFPTSGKGIFFIDEISSAPPAMQSVLFQLVLEKRIGDYKLPEGFKVIAAGNKDTDRGVTYKMSTPLASRFVHINLDVDNEDWIKWALNAGIDPMVIAFIKFRPALLHSFDPTAGHQTFPCPRTWSFVSKFITGDDYNSVNAETISGIIGQGASAEFMGFLKVYLSLPEIETILNTPDTARVPTEPAALYAVSSALARKEIIQKHSESILTYSMRLPAEFAIMCIRDCMQIDSTVCQNKKFSTFAKKYAEILI